MSGKQTSIVIFALLWHLAVHALAVPVLGNLGQPTSAEGVPVSAHSWQASSFQVLPDSPQWWVESVTLKLSEVGANPTLKLTVVGESAFRPNLADVRIAFNAPVLDEGDAFFTAKATPLPILNPGETYWLVLGVESVSSEATIPAGLYHWHYALNSQADSFQASSWTFGVQTASAGTAGADWEPEATTPYSFTISANRNLAPLSLAQWRDLHPGGPLDEATFLAGDPDGNGLNGLAEFAYDSDPTQLPVSMVDEDGRLGLEYVRWSHAPELTWVVKHSTDLDDWQPVGIDDAEAVVALIGKDKERVRVWLIGEIDRVFLRVDVSKS